MKLIESLLITYICLICKIHPFKFTNLIEKTKYNYIFNANYILKEGPTYAKGWLKYLKYQSGEKNKPPDFLKNLAFYEQMKSGLKLDLTKSDKVGYVNIPDEDHFFFVLTAQALNVRSSRKSGHSKTVDILNLGEISKNLISKEFSGGVEDHGDFSEGFCFRINSRNIKNKSFNIWELCADSQTEKLNWMNTIANLRNKKIYNLNEIEDKSISKTKNNIPKPNSTGISIKTKENVSWVPITTWSECTKSCGGGKSYLQRMCMVPPGSKEKCTGERIVSKDCNLQPCESDGTISELFHLATKMKKENLKIKNATIKDYPLFSYMPVSRKPLRYERCIIKEGDLAIYTSEGMNKASKIPVRVILNNSTLTAYTSDDYDSILFSFNLTSITGLRKFTKENTDTCFEVEEGKNKASLCTFVSSKQSLQDMASEWQNDILDFTKNCTKSHSKELDFKSINGQSLEKVHDSFDFYDGKDKDQMEKMILKSQQLSLQAIEKELKVENLIEKEEELKQKNLEEQINIEFEKIKKQKELINLALQEKKKQADIYANKLMIKKKIKQINQQVRTEVLKIREDLKSRILSKQKDEKRKRELILNKINSLKNEISKSLLRASKNGDYEECNPDRKTKEIIEYCKVNYENDNTKMTECVKNDNFCYMCCESEFGDLHLESRSNCYTKCDDFYIYKIKFKGEPKKTNSKLKSINDSLKFKEQDEFEKLSEKEKKKELLLDIKSDLNLI